MRPVLILYCSKRGSTQEAALILAECLDQLSLPVCVHDAVSTDPAGLSAYPVIVLGTYSYWADGQFPDELLPFIGGLVQQDLSGCAYAVFGSGDSKYPNFCGAVDRADAAFRRTGAIPLQAGIKFNGNPSDQTIRLLEDLAQKIRAWAIQAAGPAE